MVNRILLLLQLFLSLPALATDIGQLQVATDLTPLATSILDEDDRPLSELIGVMNTQGTPVSQHMTGGYHRGFFWVRLNLSNGSDTAAAAHLMLRNRLISHLEYFIPNAQQEGAASVRRLRSTVPTLEIKLPPKQELQLYLKLQFGLQDNLSLDLVPASQSEGELLRATMRTQEMFFGIILGLLIFNVALFFLTKEISFLLHALSAFFAFAVIFLAGGLAYYYFYDDRLNRFLPVFGCLAVASMNGFGQAYLAIQKSHRRLSRLLRIGYTTGIAGAILLSFGLDKRIIYFTDLNLLLLIVVGFLLVYTFPPTRFRNMRFYVVGWLSLGVSGVAWLGSEYGIFERTIYTESSFSFGMALEMIIVSLGLADRINHYKNELENYNRNLEKTVDEKTRDIRSIMEYIPIGICMITAKNFIHRDYSRRFREFFPQSDLETKAAGELLFEQAVCTSDEKSQAISCLSSALGEDIISFETNAHTLPAEMQWIDPSHKTHTMDLTWNPMQNAQGSVERILVTMRDVSDLRKLQERSRSQQEELDIIKEILDTPADKFQRFLVNCHETLSLCARQLRSPALADGDAEVLRQLFLNTHTIKGVARSFYFKELTRILHDLEQSYAEAQHKTRKDWNLEKMQKDVAAAEAVLNRYEQIAREKLNRSVDQHRSIELPLDYAQQLYRRIDTLLSKRDWNEAARDLDQFRRELHGKVFRDAREVFLDLCSSLPSLAKDLHKEVPEVDLDVEGYALTETTEDLVRNVFVHILRNSMDHGLETAAEREAKGKSPAGRIHIRMSHAGNNVILRVADDGQGLHIKRIRELGLKLGLIQEQEGSDPQKVAELIFDAGLSTAEKVTEISGRGVGMDAIRQFVRDSGGDIRILLGARTSNTEFQSFEFEIIWPASLFEPRPGALQGAIPRAS